jgi:tetrapyrrole methylase family protein/MazG family protein
MDTKEHIAATVVNKNADKFARFCDVVATICAPDGCPWDAEQTHASIAKNMIEEAYEAVDTIEHNDTAGMREELGDVLLQVVLQSQIAASAGEFTIGDVIDDITDKMVRRHPHVFGNEHADTAAEALAIWDKVKLREKEAAAKAAGDASNADKTGAGTGHTDATIVDVTAQEPVDLLKDVPESLPALMQAQNISRKAVSAGFEWDNVDTIWQQVRSEIDEYNAEEPGSQAAEEEFGDVLFSLVNVARKQEVDAESALRASCRKFRTRWHLMEGYAARDGRPIESYSVQQLEDMWQTAKAELKHA